LNKYIEKILKIKRKTLFLYRIFTKMVRISENGVKYYYYYKKKVGRHKKTGKKRKPKKRGRSWQEQWNYKVIRCVFNKQIEYLGKFHDIEEIEEYKKVLTDKNSEIILPKIYSTKDTRWNTKEYKSEYVFLEKTRVSGNLESKIRNEYGKLVTHTTSSDKWVVYDKMPCLVEETFWMYGYNPHSDKKTVTWIVDNYIYDEISESPNIVIQIFVYKNKVLMRYDSNRIEFVICKNGSDAIRLYNKIFDLIETHYRKNKWCIRMGDLQNYDFCNKMLLDLQKLTGWSMYKIRGKIT